MLCLIFIKLKRLILATPKYFIGWSKIYYLKSNKAGVRFETNKNSLEAVSIYV